MKMDFIESTQNNQVKEWKKLLTRKGRKKQHRYIIEGEHLVEEAIKAQALIEAILIREEKWSGNSDYNEELTILISEEISALLSDTVTDQGIFAILKMNEEDQTITGKAPVLFLDEIQDPGNLGTLIRSADAAGFEGVIVGKGSVDLYNPKALRSAQGSHLHLPVIHDDLSHWIEAFKAKGIDVFGTALDERAVSYLEVSPIETFALIVGNEGNGVDAEILEQTTKNLYIPIKGKAESLNVAIAASILMFSLYR